MGKISNRNCDKTGHPQEKGIQIGIPGSFRTFKQRSGGYTNYQYDTIHPEKNDSRFMLSREEAEEMLEDVNSFIEKYFPWMEDFILLQLKDGTIRLDVADRGFLG